MRRTVILHELTIKNEARVKVQTYGHAVRDGGAIGPHGDLPFAPTLTNFIDSL